MMQIIQLKGKDKQLYELVAPLVMDPDVIRANNNYPFKTTEDFVWFIAVESREVIGFIPVEQKSGKKAIINNYYVEAEKERRTEILSALLSSLISVYESDKWFLEAITLVQDHELFGKFEFVSLEKKWTRYVKMRR